MRIGVDRWPLHNFFLFLLVLLFFGFTGCINAEALHCQESGIATSRGPVLSFAIADLDQDRRPDIASVEGGANNSGTTDYWIRLQLSAIGKRSILLVAPTGGLTIEARDVNGDNAVDLIFVTAWSKRPVAVLLNDGYGGFSHAEPTAFPNAFSNFKTSANARSTVPTSDLGVPSFSRDGIHRKDLGKLDGRSATSRILLSNVVAIHSSFSILHAGRAPPSLISHS